MAIRRANLWLVMVMVASLLLRCDADREDEVHSEEEAATPTTAINAARLTPLAAPADGPPISTAAASNIAQVWANDGGDKVTRDELRAISDTGDVLNSVWNGSEISLFGARNEIVSFNLVLETPAADALGVNLKLTELIGPDQTAITTRPARGDDLFNYVGRNIELFYVRYLQILGISTDLFFAGFDYDERHIPARCRRPHDADGEGTGHWEDRPCHGDFYPDIAVPLELEAPFTIEGGRNQSIWADIYIPQDIPAGEYAGTITVSEE
jgi:hypothetical protein